MRKVALSVLASLFAYAAPASATVYTFSFDSGYGAGTGSFTTAGDASASFSQIVSLNGTLGTDALTLLAPGTYPAGAANTNLFTETSPYFDFGGLSFAAGGLNYNLYANGGVRLCGQTSSCANTSLSAFQVQAAAVPEPGTWALMLLGFGAVGYSMRRSRSAARFAPAV